MSGLWDHYYTRDAEDGLPPYLEYLNRLGVFDTSHGKRSLGEHLIKTHDMMITWDCPSTWCLAGLYHSIYGTAYFTHESTTDRDSVREVIGQEAENFVYLFCKLQTSRIENILGGDFDENIKIALLSITAANNLEQGGRSNLRRYFKTMPSLLAEKIIQTEKQQEYRRIAELEALLL